MEAYTQIGSLREYWVVEQEEVRVTRCYRTADGWGLRHYTDLGESIRSEHLDVEVVLAELYRRVF